MGYKGTVLAGELMSALKSVTPFASSDGTVPVLSAVHVSAADSRLAATTTDRYTIGRYAIGYDGDALAFTVDVRDVATILLTLKAVAKNGQAPAELIIEGSRLTVKVWDSEVTVTVGDAGAFPRLDDVWPKKEQAGLPSGRVNFNPALLAKFAKVVDTSKSGVMRMWCGERETVSKLGGKETRITQLRPVLVEIGEHFTGLIMPIRVES